MDPFDPPAADASVQDRAMLPMVQYARIMLLFLAVAYGLLGISVPFLYVGMAMTDPEIPEEAAPFMAGVGICVGVFVIAMAVAPNIAAYVGLGRGKKWAWIVTIIVGAYNLPSLCCVPFGAFLLYAMLNDEVRKAFNT